MKHTNCKLNWAISLFPILFVSIYCSFILHHTFWGDPSIYLIFSKNIVSGDWFSFNPGEFSSGSTSPLWAIILSLGYLLPDGIFGAKLISSILTLLALYCMYHSINCITKVEIASIFGMLPFIFSLIVNGNFIYEAPLIVILICCLIIVNWKLLTQKKLFPFLGIIWSMIPVSRPEMTLLIVANFLCVLFYFRNEGKKILSCCLLFILSLIPAIIYFGYSYFLTNAFSSSSYCRLFSILEMPFLLNENLRYLIPITPLLALILAIVYKWVYLHFKIFALLLLILVSPICLAVPIAYSVDQASRHLSFDVITERNVTDKINQIAQSGSLILMYEIQDRYYLRNDLSALSLDGITDGKIAPFFQDVSGYLRKYKPTYWIANDSVKYRPFLSRSILYLVSESTDEIGDQYIIDGIRFINIWVNPDYGKYPSFANASAIYLLVYD